jgi:hypothetical protein
VVSFFFSPRPTTISNADLRVPAVGTLVTSPAFVCGMLTAPFGS